MGLSVVQDSFEHLLTFALRWDDHFLSTALTAVPLVRTPVTEELQVNALSTKNRLILPIQSSVPGFFRQDDGTYRFRDLKDGHYPIQVVSLTGLWTSWDPPLVVNAPLAVKTTPIIRDLWPTPQAPVPSGMTAIRGQLRGTGVAHLKLQVVPKGTAITATTKYNFSDSFGEVLYPFPIRVKPELDGRIKLTATVAGRTISSINVLDGSDPTTQPAAPDFLISPGRATRVKFNV